MDYISISLINKDNSVRDYDFTCGLSTDEVLANGNKYAIIDIGFKQYYLEYTDDWHILHDKIIVIPNNVYLTFAVFSYNTLVSVTNGSFASRAWLQSDKLLSKVMGNKFEYISLENGRYYCDDKRCFRRLHSLEEFKKLLSDNVILVGEPTFEVIK